MRLDDVHSYADLEKYLREFINWFDDPVPYDFHGVVRLLLAALDNLQKNALEAELEDVGYFLNDSQREYLAKLAIYANRVTDEDDDF